MVSQNVDKLLQQVKLLDPQERKQLLEKLNGESLQEPPHPSEQEFVADLAKKGIIITVPPLQRPRKSHASDLGSRSKCQADRSQMN